MGIRLLGGTPWCSFTLAADDDKSYYVDMVQATIGENQAPATTRERILAAAAEVFAERGYEGAAVSDSARRAGPTTVATLFLAIPLGIVLLDAAGVEVPGADTWAEVARQTAISLRPQDVKEA